MKQALPAVTLSVAIHWAARALAGQAPGRFRFRCSGSVIGRM